MGAGVHLCRVHLKAQSPLDGTLSVVLTSRPIVVLMRKLDDGMNYNVHHLIMPSMLLETYYVLL